MSRLGEMQGTPWHVEKFTRKEGDARRHRSHCIHYDKGSKHCDVTGVGCRGASHCQRYSIQKPKQTIKEKTFAQTSIRTSSKTLAIKQSQNNYTSKNTPTAKRAEQKINTNMQQKINSQSSTSSINNAGVKESIERLFQLFDETQNILGRLASNKEQYQEAEEKVSRNVQQMIINLSAVNEKLKRKYNP